MVKAKVYKYVKAFEGVPKKTDLKLVEEDLPPLKDGEFLAEAVYLSVDPYMRKHIVQFPTGITMIGGQVAKITDSKHPEFPVGKFVVTKSGWRSHSIINGDEPRKIEPYILPDLGNLSPSLGLGVLGAPGNTAYFLFLDVCKPKAGETMVVSGAGGAVGSLVGQIGKIKGLKVIGIAGTEEKGQWITKELGFDHFINYKTQNIDQELSKLAPNGVDCYFDNVGGQISATVLGHMNRLGRVCTCGNISDYNTGNPYADLLAKQDNKAVVDSKQLHVARFLVSEKADQWFDGINQMHQWVKEGKLKYRETFTNGFENMYEAFVDMLKGGNIGKAIVKV